MEFTVFYAWQSDRKQEINKKLILEAAKTAVNNIAEDVTVEECPSLDQDTQNIGGAPDIVQTIFEKISSCGIFLADVTLVAKLPQKSKKLPNSNVLIELGYAAKAIGWERIVLVMNTVHGGPEELPFDLRARRPIMFQCNKMADYNDAMTRLVSEIDGNIRDIVRTEKFTEWLGTANVCIQPWEAEQTIRELHQELKAGRFMGMSMDHGALVITVIPSDCTKKDIHTKKLESQVLEAVRPINTTGWNHVRTPESIRGFPGNGENPEAATELLANGVIIAVNRDLPRKGNPNTYFEDQSENLCYLPLIYMEQLVIERAGQYVNFLKDIGWQPPYYVGVALLNLRPTVLEPNPTRYNSGNSRVFRNGDIVPHLITVDGSDKPLSSDQVREVMEPTLRYIRQEFGI